MDNQIAHAVLNAFTEKTGIKTTWKQNGSRYNDPNHHGLVRFSIFKHSIEIPGEVKNKILTAHLPDLHRRKEKLKNLIVLADYMMPKEQEQLKKSLKPGLFMHRFDFLHEEDFDQWKQLKFKNELTCWGAEPAGELLTNNLKPIERNHHNDLFEIENYNLTTLAARVYTLLLAKKQFL